VTRKRKEAFVAAIDSRDLDRKDAAAASRLWGVVLLGGILFLILGFIILSYNATSLTTVSILIGVSFVFTGINWLFISRVEPELRGWFVVGGILALIAGIIAFVYPDETLRVLSLILGWFLLVVGLLDIVVALTNRNRDLWWLRLITGIVMFGLGAWAVREDNRSILLLVTITGVYCLLRGIVDIIVAFALRSVKKELVG
jgi:uncharacterized membrane protein HdeD (DUF308 family)